MKRMVLAIMAVATSFSAPSFAEEERKDKKDKKDEKKGGHLGGSEGRKKRTRKAGKPLLLVLGSLKGLRHSRRRPFLFWGTPH
jgi:hypothetical protein